MCFLLSVSERQLCRGGGPPLGLSPVQECGCHRPQFEFPLIKHEENKTRRRFLNKSTNAVKNKSIDFGSIAKELDQVLLYNSSI